MNFDWRDKRAFPCSLAFLFFISMWLIKELQYMLNSGTLDSYLIITNKNAFNYFDNLMLSSMYMPLYLLFEYMLWHENSQAIIRFRSRIRYLFSQTIKLLISTVFFWGIFFLIGILPLAYLRGMGTGTFLLLFISQTGAYCLISLEIGLVMFWLFQLLPKFHLVITLLLAVGVIIYSSLPIRPMTLFQKIDLLKRFYFMHELNGFPIPTLVILVTVPLITLCARVIWIQHEEFWQ